MLRASLAAAATLILVGVLALLIVESRAVKEEYYVAHAERMRAIEASKNDLAAITQGTQSAFNEGRSIPSSIDSAVARVAKNSRFLQSWNDTSRQESTVQLQLAAYNVALNRFISDENSFAARQNALAEGLRSLQDESPAVVKDLRRFNLRIQSQNAFSLAIQVIEYATGQSSSDLKQIENRIEALRSDSELNAQAPGRLDNFVKAASTVITEHLASESALEKISSSRIAGQLIALSDAVVLENRRTVQRAERARLLLSFCAVLFLAGTGFVMVRLQSSYRALNKSNADLEKVNNSLEDRVSSRTEELSFAYDELKESQVQLVQAEKMSSLGELVAGISHEINTPLYYLTTNSTVIQERLSSARKFYEIAESMMDAVRSQSSVKEAVSQGLIEMQKMFNNGMMQDLDEAEDLMKDSISGLEDLIELAQSLKDFSRLDRARQGEFNVNDGLDKTLLIAKNKLKYNITVNKHYGDVSLIHCSPSQINQIFLNLITNSADAIADNGEIVIRTWNEGANICISIADTGCGIPAEVLQKVRDPFFTTKEVGKGTGLGLSIVDQIVTAHSGELRVESEPDKGTTVTVVLPIRGADPSEDSAAGGHDTSLSSEAPATATDSEESRASQTVPDLAAV